MADFLENMLRALKLVPERVDTDRAEGGLANELTQMNIDPLELDYKRGLLGYKDAYDNAQLQYNQADNPALQAQLGMSAEQIRQQAQNAMNQAHLGAEQHRTKAKSLGYNLDDYGAGVPLDKASANLQSEIRNMISGNDMTSEQYYDEVYRRLHEAGLPMRQAQQEAARRANLYKSQRLAKYSNMFNTLGQSGGVMTEYAPQIMDMIARDMEDPQTAVANVLANMYPNLKEQYQNEWNATQNAAARADAHESAMQQIEAQFRNGFATRADMAKWNDFLASQNSLRDLNKIGYQWQLGQFLEQQKQALEERKARIEAQAKQQEEYRKSPEYKYKQYFDAAMTATGGDFNMSSAIAFGQTFTDWINQNKGSTKDKEAQQKIATAFNGQHGAIEYLLSLNTPESDERAKQSIAQIESAILDADGKYQEWLDYEDAQAELDRLNLYKKALNKEITYQELRNKLYNETTETPTPEPQQKLSDEEMKKATKNQYTFTPFNGNTYYPGATYIPGSAGATLAGGR